MGTLTKQPSRIHTAFNPTMVEFSGSGEQELNVWLYSTSDADDHVIDSAVLKSEYINGKAQFNLKHVLTSWFIDQRDEYLFENEQHVDNATIVHDYNLFVDYLVREINHTRRYTAVNAASQFGESQDFISRMHCKWLTGFKRLRLYDGYELSASFLIGTSSDNASYMNIDGEFVENESGDVVSFQESERNHATLIVDAEQFIDISNSDTDYYLRDDQGRIILDSTGEPILVENVPSTYKHTAIAVKSQETPEHPFYVRWVNRFGGYDYWMMACKQFFTLSLSGSSTYNKYYDDVETATGDTFVYDKTATRKVKVSSGLCSIDDLKELQWLPLSPRIEWYNEDTQKWVNLICNNTDTELGTAQSSGSIEFTFALPSPQIQY